MKKLYFFFLALMAMMIWPVGVWAQTDVEALWGTDADNLTSSGTFSSAVYAADAGEAAYIQLQKNVTTDRVYFNDNVKCTIDLNGDTLAAKFQLFFSCEITLVDQSAEQTGYLTNNNSEGSTIELRDSAIFNLYSGKVYSDGLVIYQYDNTLTTVNIYGGTVESKTNVPIYSCAGNEVRIEGGRFISGGLYAMYIMSNAYISGGEYVYDQSTDFNHTIRIDASAVLDLSDYPTEPTEGVKPFEQLALYSAYSISNLDFLTLPKGYCLMDVNGEVVDAIAAGNVYHFGPKPAPEALWGTDADNLTMSGTLKQAIDAANAGQASYIQLQMSMTNATYYYFSGAYAATLDLNGDTINACVKIEEGFALTIVDSSEEQTGLVSSEVVSIPTMRLENAGILNLRGGKIQDLNTIVVSIKGVNSTANIYGGTVESSNNSVIDTQHGSFLNITGGRFISGSDYLFYLKGHTTISGGEFEFDTTQYQSCTFTLFDTSTLDLSQYPTTATEGVTPIEELTLFSYDPITVADAFTLPEGYSVLDKDGNKVDEILSDIYHFGPTPAPQALWGTDADNLTHEGSLMQAFDAANAGQASYIQLQMSMTNAIYYTFYGTNAATLDLNGDTINAGVTIKDGFALTIVDSSEEQTGLVSCEELGLPTMRLENAGILNLRGGKIYSLNTFVVSIRGVNSTANIYGGTLESGETTVIQTNEGTTLNIIDGRFVTSYPYLLYLKGHATISGGEFVYDTTQSSSNAMAIFSTTTLDLSQYPTTTTPGTTPIEELTLLAYNPITVADAFTLPEGYSVLDNEGNKVDEIVSGIYHIGPTPAPEALWGTDADNLTMSGKLMQAFDAANAGQASYIQLQQSVKKEDYYIFSGTNATTLDLNGDTIVGGIEIIDGFALTILDSSDEQTGLVKSTSGGSAVIFVSNSATLNLYSGKIYHSEMMAIQVIPVGNPTVNIYGGTLESGDNSVIDISPGSFLNITGGRFISGSYYLFYLQGHATISGGEFVYDTTQNLSSTFAVFNTTTLDLSQYPTTATEGTTPIEEFTLFSYDSITVADAFTLPEGYSVLDKDGNKMDEIKNGIYHIGPTPEEKPLIDPEAELVALSDPSHLVGQYQAHAESMFNDYPDEYWDVEITQDATDANKLWIKPFMLLSGLPVSSHDPIYMLFDPATGTLTVPGKQVIYEDDEYTFIVASMNKETLPTIDNPITPQTYMLHDTLQIVITQPMGIGCTKSNMWWFQALYPVFYTKVGNINPSSVENIHGPLPSANGQKILRDGQLIILRDGKEYNAMGQPLL